MPTTRPQGSLYTRIEADQGNYYNCSDRYKDDTLLAKRDDEVHITGHGHAQGCNGA